jgi:KipI family sensor histidine kinase inhibitor
MPHVHLRRVGERGVLVETGSLAASHRLDALLRAERPPGVTEIVPGPETVLVVADGDEPGRDRGDGTECGSRDDGHDGDEDGTAAGAGDSAAVGAEGGTAAETGRGRDAGPDMGRLRATLVRLARMAAASEDGPVDAGPPVVIPVVYDGADLDAVSELTGLSTAEIIERHTGRELVVGWLGFAPGFAYLVGLDPALHVPRLATPRTSVPAGSVAIAGPYAAVYPGTSPGGWRLLGRTEIRVWNAAADPPSILRPGTRVRFTVNGRMS